MTKARDNSKFGNFAGNEVFLDSDKDTSITADTDDQIDIKTGGTDRVHIDSSGNVGIGTSSPGADLHIANIAPLIRLTDTNDSNVDHYINGSGSALVLSADENNELANSTLRFAVDGSERMRIDSSGNVGIGTSSPASLLELQGTSTTAKIHISSTSLGTSSFDGSGAGLLLTAVGMNTTSKFTPAIQFGSTDTQFTTTNPKTFAAINGEATQAYSTDSTGGGALVFYTTPNDPGTGQTTTERMRIDDSGNVGIGTSSPNAKLHVDVGSGNDAYAIISGGTSTLVINGDIENIGDSGTSDAKLVLTGDGNYNSSNNSGFGNYSYVIHQLNQAAVSSLAFTETRGTGAVYERMRIDSSGNVGIGTSSPTHKLHVQGTSNDTIDETKGTMKVQASGGNGMILGTIASSPFTSYIQSAFVQDTSLARYNLALNPIGGNVGIGVTTTQGHLHVDSEIVGTYGRAVIAATTADPTVDSTNQLIVCAFTGDDNCTNGTFISFRDSGGEIGHITCNGTSSVQYSTSSDYRLKENVDYTFDATTRLKQLKPCRFNFKADTDKTVDGFLAHEVSSIVPEAISGEKDAMITEEYEVTPAVLDDDGNIVEEAVMGTREVPDYQGIDQSKLVPLLVKTCQEQQTIIEDLQTRITALENN